MENLKRILVLTLVFSLIAGHMPEARVYAADPTDNSKDLDDHQKEVNAFADAIDNGKISKLPIQQFDSLHYAGQRVEYYLNDSTGRIVNLDDLRVNTAPIAYTRVRAYFKEDTHEVVLEATRGENNRGENGTVVARQFIPNLDIVALAQDDEIISMIDRQGRLLAIDMGYVSEQLFKSPMPVFAKLWEPATSIDLSGKKLEATYLTRGVLPVDENLIMASGVYPQNSEGKVKHKAGDLLVIITSGSQKTVYGLFSRETTSTKIIRGSILIRYLAALVSADPNELKDVQAAIKQLEDYNAIIEAQLAQENMPIANREALVSFGHQQLESLNKRVNDHTEYNKRRSDEFSSEEWKKSYEEFSSKLDKAVEKANAEKSRLPVLQEDWQSFVTPVEPTTPQIKKEKRSYLARSLDKFQALRTPRVLGSIFAGLGVAAIALPYAADAGMIDQIKSLMWIYDHYPTVLKDAEYRTPLLLSMTSLMALWPFALVTSYSAGKTLDLMAKAAHDSKSKAAGVIRDLQRNWSPMSNWQRITSFGMRLYSYLIYPYWKVLIKTAFRQKAFFSALENNLNPFERVNPDSELGQMLGLKKSQFVGLNNPLLSNGKLADSINEKSRIQGTKLEIQKRQQSLAWLLAAVVVSEDSKIDLATLLAMGPTGLSTEKIEDLSLTKEEEWYMLTHMIHKELRKLSLKETMQELNQIPREDIAKFYKIAKDTSEKLNSTSKNRLKLIELNQRYKRMSLALKIKASQFGEAEANFLRKVYTNDFVTDQVKQEFTTDHAMVVGIYGLHGDRANLADPANLSADSKGFLWTSGPHLYDVGLNTFIHFFISGARTALVFQGVKAKAETRYLPMEDFEYVPETRTEPVLPTVKNWTKEVANPLKADLGGIMINRLGRSFTTIQAGLTLNLILRYGLTTQTLSQAFAAWVLTFAASQWYFGWIWDPVQQGNSLQRERYKAMTENIKSIRSEISLGIRQGPSGSVLRDQGAAKMRDLYVKNSPQTLELVEKQKGSELDAQELLNLSVISSPIYTRPHPSLTWFTNWTGAVVSTALSVPLVVMTFSPGALEPLHIGGWILFSAGLYTASYFALAKKPWEFYLRKIDEFKSMKTYASIKKTCGSILEKISKKD